MRTHSSLQSVVALFTAVSFTATPFAEAIAAAQAAPAKPASTPAKPAVSATPAKPAATATPATAAPAPADGGWPKVSTTPAGAHLTLYTPQVSSWDNKEHIVAYAAVVYEVPGAEKPILGTVKYEADTSVAMDKRLVSLEKLKISEMNFATASREQTQDIAAELQTGVNSKPQRVIALDRVLANIDKSAIIPKNVEGVKADPPTIFYSATKAILVDLDGDPIWSPIKENDLKYAVNTNWDLFQHGPTKHALPPRRQDAGARPRRSTGRGRPRASSPESFKKLPGRRQLEGGQGEPSRARSSTRSKMPKVFVSTAPAEMILMDGAPNYSSWKARRICSGSATRRATCSAWAKTGPIYYLVSGRWFSAPDFTGPWTFATPTLPPRVQADSARARRARACSRRSPAPTRPLRPCCSRRCRRPRA